MTRQANLLIRASVAALTLGVVAPGAALAGDALSCKLDRYAAGPLTASMAPNAVDLAWKGANGQDMAMRLGVVSGVPVIERLAINGQTIGENLRVEYKVTTGFRRMSNQQMVPLRELGIEITDKEIEDHKWDAFWDSPLDMRPPPVRRPPPAAPGAPAPPPGSPAAQAPLGLGGNPPPAAGVASQPGLPRNPNEVAHVLAKYAADGCSVISEGARLSVSFPKMTAGVFAGELVLTVFEGTNLIKADFVAKTDGKSVAFKYNAGLTGLPIAANSSVLWRDTGNMDQAYTLKGKQNEDIVPLFAANRLVVGKTPTGAVAAFPPPHTFFWAREHEDNPGNNWYRKDSATTYSIGIRQPEMETEEEYFANWALYSAPPGTEQHMSTYFYPVLGSEAGAFDGALAFTSKDRYPSLPGYKVMASHFHTSLGERVLETGNLDTRLPDFEVLRSAGVQIANLADRPSDRDGRRLVTMNALYEAAQRQSDDTFTVMPSLENSAILGGHWDLLNSKPVYWLEGRKEGEPFTRTDPKYGTVYNVGTPAEMMEMVKRENLLVYMPHPRTKGSTHYPDAVKETLQFNDDNYRGVGWRWGMGSDLSEKRLSEKRVIPLFDEMANWMTAKSLRPKYLLSITETYRKGPGDDIYANGPVNYLRLNSLPVGGDYSPVIDVLKKGDYFVSTGEVLIPNHSITGTGRTMVLNADLKWTFPLDFVEVVWGDGKKTFSKVVPTKDLPAFGSKSISVPFDGRGAKWVRVAAWDTAGNGAMTQPVEIKAVR